MIRCSSLRVMTIFPCKDGPLSSAAATCHVLRLKIRYSLRLSDRKIINNSIIKGIKNISHI